MLFDNFQKTLKPDDPVMLASCYNSYWRTFGNSVNLHGRHSGGSLRKMIRDYLLLPKLLTCSRAKSDYEQLGKSHKDIVMFSVLILIKRLLR